MGEYTCLLITILYEANNTLLRCALKLRSKDVPEFAMEPEHRKFLHSCLPPHVASCGPIVAIDEIFEIETEVK